MAPKRRASAKGNADSTSAAAAEPASKRVRGGDRTAKAAIDTKCINTIRILGAEMPFKAKSGHPGAPMGCAPMAYALFGFAMNFSPKHPEWINRDRFVLSNGHGCALQYAMLHLLGYDLSIEDLKNFRQLHSKTPGHPECFVTPGVEVCTGPLGQGISNAVGMAIASHHLAAKYNKGKTMQLFNNYTYVVCGDGCLMEGISSEACSLAGHLGLGRLIVLYDSNSISIDGSTDLAFTEDTATRFKSYKWHVQEVSDGDKDHKKILEAIEKAKNQTAAPSLIVVNTTIGFGSKNEGTEKVHGAPLSEDDLKAVKAKFEQDPEKSFHVADDVRDFFKQRKTEGDAKYTAWCQLYEKYKAKYPEEAAELERRFSQGLPDLVTLKSWLPAFAHTDKPDGTRSYSQKTLQALAKKLPEIIGGSADLTDSNKTDLHGEADFNAKTQAGRYIRFGVREHGMAAIVNGMFAYGGFRPFCATFLNFLTYAWGAVRLSALSRFSPLYIMTHDSIDLGEDGPTHQPIETLALTRATPNMLTFRPADGNEVNGSYVGWLTNPTRPSIIALNRSAVPAVLCGTSVDGVLKGGYIVQDFLSKTGTKLIFGSSGSELHLCYDAAKLIKDSGIDVDIRIVSMPCWELFDEQSAEYRAAVLPKGVKKVYVEALTGFGTHKYFDASVTMSTFGASAPRPAVWKYFGFTKYNIANTGLKALSLPELVVPDADRPVHTHMAPLPHPRVRNICDLRAPSPPPKPYNSADPLTFPPSLDPSFSKLNSPRHSAADAKAKSPTVKPASNSRPLSRPAASLSPKPPASPKATILSPKATIGSPKPGLACPKAAIGSPKPGLASPKAAIGSPKPGLASPKAAIGSPKAGLASPKAGAAASPKASSSPKAAMLGSPKPPASPKAQVGNGGSPKPPASPKAANASAKNSPPKSPRSPPKSPGGPKPMDM